MQHVFSSSKLSRWWEESSKRSWAVLKSSAILGCLVKSPNIQKPKIFMVKLLLISQKKHHLQILCFHSIQSVWLQDHLVMWSLTWWLMLRTIFDSAVRYMYRPMALVVNLVNALMRLSWPCSRYIEHPSTLHICDQTTIKRASGGSKWHTMILSNLPSFTKNVLSFVRRNYGQTLQGNIVLS